MWDQSTACTSRSIEWQKILCKQLGSKFADAVYSFAHQHAAANTLQNRCGKWRSGERGGLETCYLWVIYSIHTVYTYIHILNIQYTRQPDREIKKLINLSNHRRRIKTEKRPRSSLLFVGKNLFNSLPCLGWTPPPQNRSDDLCLFFCLFPLNMTQTFPPHKQIIPTFHWL